MPFVQNIRGNYIVFTAVQREWTKGKETRRETDSGLEGDHEQGAASVMMWRWYQETMCAQPYNNIGAIGTMVSGEVAGQVSHRRNDRK